MMKYLATYEVSASVEALDDNEAKMKAELLVDIMRDALMPADPAFEEPDITLERVVVDSLG